MITRETLIGDVVELNENAADILMEFGMHCLGCMIAGGETLEDGARTHGFSEEEIDEIIKRLNK